MKTKKEKKINNISSHDLFEGCRFNTTYLTENNHRRLGSKRNSTPGGYCHQRTGADCNIIKLRKLHEIFFKIFLRLSLP